MIEAWDFLLSTNTITLIGWSVVSIATLYLARTQAHLIIRRIFQSISIPLRHLSVSFNLIANSLLYRNKEAAKGQAHIRLMKNADRSYLQLRALIVRDLAHYPAMHERLQTLSQGLEDKYQLTADDANPVYEGWSNLINDVSYIDSLNDENVVSLMTEMQLTMSSTHASILSNMKSLKRNQQRQLTKSVPTTRKILETLDRLEHVLVDVDKHSTLLDKHVETLNQIKNNQDLEQTSNNSSPAFQLIISSVVLVIAVFGAFVNYNLVELPMREMVGGGQYVQGIPVSAIGAMVIIAIEIVMGLFIMEFLGVTNLFQGLDVLDEKMRKRLLWLAIIILFSLACIESALAYMRDILAAQAQVFNAELDNKKVVEVMSVIPMIGQVVLGFILPFALMFIAVPLETFLTSGMSMVRYLFSIILKILAFVCRLVGLASKQVGSIVNALYDMVVIVPLTIERLSVKHRTNDRRALETKRQ